MLTLKDIKKSPVFSKFTLDQLKIVLKNSVEKTMSQGEILFSTGDKRNAFFVIIQGKVAIIKQLGESAQIIEIVTEGEYIAEQALFNPKSKHSHTASIYSNFARILYLPGKRFKKLPAEIKLGLVLNLLPIISDNFHHASNRIVTIAEIGNILGSDTNSTEELGNKILSILLQVINAQKAMIVLRQFDQTQIKIKSLLGFKDAMYNKTIKINDDPFIERIILKGETENISEKAYITSNKKVDYASKSLLGTPLAIGKEVIGAILLLDKNNDDGFNTNNEVLLKIAANMVSLKIYQNEKKEIEEAQKELKREYINL